jgi:hypothetical protein
LSLQEEKKVLGIALYPLTAIVFMVEWLTGHFSPPLGGESLPFDGPWAVLALDTLRVCLFVCLFLSSLSAPRQIF